MSDVPKHSHECRLSQTPAASAQASASIYILHPEGSRCNTADNHVSHLQVEAAEVDAQVVHAVACPPVLRLPHLCLQPVVAPPRRLQRRSLRLCHLRSAAGGVWVGAQTSCGSTHAMQQPTRRRHPAAGSLQLLCCIAVCTPRKLEVQGIFFALKLM